METAADLRLWPDPDEAADLLGGRTERNEPEQLLVDSAAVMKRFRDSVLAMTDVRDAALYAGMDLASTGDGGCRASDVVPTPLDKVPARAKLATTISLARITTAYDRDETPPTGVTLDQRGNWLVPVWVPCTVTKHKAKDLCMNHYNRIRYGGTWESLNLTGPPTGPPRSAWRKTTLDATGLTNYVLQKVLGRRAPNKNGYWRTIKKGTATAQLPDPPKFDTAEQYWALVKLLNDRADELTAAAERLRVEVRDPALYKLFPTEPSNKKLAALTLVGEFQIYVMRSKARKQQSA